MARRSIFLGAVILIIHLSVFAGEKAKIIYELNADLSDPPSTSFYANGELVLLYVVDSLGDIDTIRVSLKISIENGAHLAYPLTVQTLSKSKGKIMVIPWMGYVSIYSEADSYNMLYLFLPRHDATDKSQICVININAFPVNESQLKPGKGAKVIFLKAMNCLEGSKGEQGSYIYEVLKEIAGDGVYADDCVKQPSKSE
jgi:hypothetical protein